MKFILVKKGVLRYSDILATLGRLPSTFGNLNKNMLLKLIMVNKKTQNPQKLNWPSSESML